MCIYGICAAGLVRTEPRRRRTGNKEMGTHNQRACRLGLGFAANPSLRVGVRQAQAGVRRACGRLKLGFAKLTYLHPVNRCWWCGPDCSRNRRWSGLCSAHTRRTKECRCLGCRTVEWDEQARGWSIGDRRHVTQPSRKGTQCRLLSITGRNPTYTVDSILPSETGGGDSVVWCCLRIGLYAQNCWRGE